VTKRFRIADVPVADTWAVLEKFVQAGKIRSIGTSNFTVEATQSLLKTAKIPSAVNQIEAHPYLLQPQLFGFLKENVRLPYVNGVLRSLTDCRMYRIFYPWLTVRSETTSTTYHGMKANFPGIALVTC